MRAIRELLKDRKRSQRGSVLSGVLIMTAFIAIISGALLTELSTNFLLSRSIVNRVAYEATDSSAIELALSSLQSAPLNAPCPSAGQATVNNLTASAGYLSCWPTVDMRSPQFRKIASASGGFNVDGVHVQMGGLNDYVVGDDSGNVYDYEFDTAAQRWNLDLDGATTAPTLVLPRPGFSGQFLDVIALSASPSCPTSAPCLDVRVDNGTFAAPSQQCLVPTTSGAAVIARPAASPSIAGLVYFGDGANLEANDVSSGAACSPRASTTISGGTPVVAGPVAFACTGACGQTIDYLYAVVADGGSSRLVEYTYDPKDGFDPVGSWMLPWAAARGMVVQSGSLPAGLAITFAGGGVTLYTLRSSGPTLVRSQTVGGGIADAPYWCGPCGLFGVGAQNGGLYLFDSSLNPVAASAGLGPAINTTPGVDGAGNWYYAAADGYVHEAQIQGGQLAEVKKYGGMGTISSGVQVGGCQAGICVFVGTAGNAVYLVPLNARDAVLSACISSGPATCSGANPRLWASVEVGDAISPRTVHVEGWSYYSG